jgi:hypothetical protein
MGTTDRKTSTLNNSITFDANADLYSNGLLNTGVGKSGGFENRKKSGNAIAGSTMVVPGQNILNYRVESIFKPSGGGLNFGSESIIYTALDTSTTKGGSFENRKKSGKIFAGSRLVVPGQDILSVKVFEPEFVKRRTVDVFSGALPPTPTPEPTPTPTPPPTSTPTPTPTPTMTPSPIVEICYLATEDYIRITAENDDNLIVECHPFPIPVPPVNYPTPTPTPTMP